MAESSQKHLVSVIIPARDEARSIGSLIFKGNESLSAYNHEIIVVDDGSVDGTGETARMSGAIVLSQKRLGKGSAMKNGVQHASGDIIVFIDGDGAHDPKDIPRLITPLLEGETDFVIGSRALPGMKPTAAPLIRKLCNNLASFIISAIISFLLPLASFFKYSMKWTRITDCTSGFRAAKKQSWQKLNLVSQGFEIEAEMIYEAARHKFIIAEVPISCNWSTNGSHLSIISDGLKTAKLLAGKLASDMKGRLT